MTAPSQRRDTSPDGSEMPQEDDDDESDGGEEESNDGKVVCSEKKLLSVMDCCWTVRDCNVMD